MRKVNTIECEHCGRVKTEYDDEFCPECGLRFVHATTYTEYTYGDINCIDNILEDKRRQEEWIACLLDTIIK